MLAVRVQGLCQVDVKLTDKRRFLFARSTCSRQITSDRISSVRTRAKKASLSNVERGSPVASARLSRPKQLLGIVMQVANLEGKGMNAQICTDLILKHGPEVIE